MENTPQIENLKLKNYFFSLTGKRFYRQIDFEFIKKCGVGPNEILSCFCKYNSFCIFHDDPESEHTFQRQWEHICKCYKFAYYELEHTSHLSHEVAKRLLRERKFEIHEKDLLSSIVQVS